jgi:hypothetical protein
LSDAEFVPSESETTVKTALPRSGDGPDAGEVLEQETAAARMTCSGDEVLVVPGRVPV